MNIKQLPKGTIILSYNDLSIDAKIIARRTVIDLEILAYSRNIKKYSDTTSIHKKINGSNIKNFISTKKFIDKLLNDINYCEKFINENLCHFISNGEYITYCI